MSVQEYYLPESIEQATNLLSGKAQGALILAGGTLVMPLINDGLSMPEQVLGLKKAGLDYIEESDGMILIGTGTTLSQVADQAIVPMLAEAALAVGGWAIRNMATVGGNLFAPPPGGDFAAALLALDAELVLIGENGRRTLPLKDFFTGFMTNVLQSGEIILEFQIKQPSGKSAFTKFGRRRSNTPSIVTVAVNIDLDDGKISSARVALNAVGPFPFRAVKTEEYLKGKILDSTVIEEAGKIAAGESKPFTDAIASEWYRRKMVPVILGRTLDMAIRRSR